MVRYTPQNKPNDVYQTENLPLHLVNVCKARRVDLLSSLSQYIQQARRRPAPWILMVMLSLKKHS